MPVVKRSKRNGKKRPLTAVFGTLIKDGDDTWAVDAVGTKNGTAVRIVVRSGGEEVLRAYLSPETAQRLAIALAHAAYMAGLGDTLKALWSQLRGGGGASEEVEEVAGEEAHEETQEEAGEALDFEEVSFA